MRGGQVRGVSQTWLQLWVKGQRWGKITYIWSLNSSFWGFWLKLNVSVSWHSLSAPPTTSHSRMFNTWRAIGTCMLKTTLKCLYLQLNPTSLYLWMILFVFACLASSGPGSAKVQPKDLGVIQVVGMRPHAPWFLPNSGSKRTDTGHCSNTINA